jgi:hypothetical protein
MSDITFGDGLIVIQDAWNAITGAINSKGLYVQHVEDAEKYDIFAVDDNVTYTTAIYKGTVPATFLTDQATNDANKVDFELNYKDSTPDHTVWVVTGTVAIDNSKPVYVSTTGSLPIVVMNQPVVVSGTINLDRGNNVASPLFVTGALSVTFPAVQQVTGTVVVTGTVNLDRGNNAASPLFVTGSMGITNQVFVTTTGSIPVIIQGQPITVTGSVGITNQVFVTTTGSLPVSFSGVQTVTGTVGVSGPVTVTTTGSLPITGSVTVNGTVTAIAAGVQVISGTVNLDRGNSAASPLFVSGAFSLTPPVIVTTTGSWPVTGAVIVSGVVTSLVTGTVNLDRGNSVASPLFVSGTVTVVPPAVQIVTVTGSLPVTGTVGVSGQVIVTTTGSLPITGTVTVSGVVTSLVTGTVNLDRGNSAASPLFITGSVGITNQVFVTTTGSIPITGTVGVSGPISISNQVTVTTTGSIPVIIQGQPINVTGSVGITNQVFVTTTGSLPVSLSGVQVTSGALNVTGSIIARVTGTVNLDRGNTITTPLYAGVTGTVNLDRGNSAASPLFVTGTVSVNQPIIVTATGSWLVTGSVGITNQVFVTTTGSLPITGSVTVSGTVISRVTGTVNLDRGNSSANPLFVSGALTVTGTVSVNQPLVVTTTGSWPVTGSVTITGPVFVQSVTPSARIGLVQGIVLLGGGTVNTYNFVGATAYNEQTTNARRSIASNNANDTAAGTGARTVLIEYFSNTSGVSGPFYETVTLNGTTPVNTISTSICYIDSLTVLTAGSVGTNVGTITLYASTGGAGAAIGTIGIGIIAPALGDRQTFWAHHYIPTGSVASFATFVVGSTVPNSNLAYYFLRYFNLSVANRSGYIVSDIIPAGNTVVRALGIPFKVPGPAKVSMWCVPTANNMAMAGNFDFSEVSA